MRRHSFVLVAITLMTGGAAAAPSGAELVYWCTSLPQNATFYIQGVRDGIEFRQGISALYEHQGGTVVPGKLCIPRNVSDEQLKVAVCDQLKQEPGNTAHEAPLAVMLSSMQIWPCP